MRLAKYAAPPIRYDWATGLFSRWYIEAITGDELAGAFCVHRTVFLIRIRTRSERDMKRLANWLRTALDPGGFAGVVGPDEIVITLVESDRASVNRLLYRVGRVVISADIGTAEFPDDGLTFEALLRSTTRQPSKVA
jgi:hypothetical protein